MLIAVDGAVNPAKLRQLRRYLTAAVGAESLSRPIQDAMVVRHSLVEQMRAEAVPSGTIHGIVQFYMGIVRRAALAGLIDAPPEGPWTRAWQAVLDLADDTSGTKAELRSLAGWAAHRSLDPGAVTHKHLTEWSRQVNRENISISAITTRLREWSDSTAHPALAGDAKRSERLRRKAAGGSVVFNRG